MIKKIIILISVSTFFLSATPSLGIGLRDSFNSQSGIDTLVNKAGYSKTSEPEAYIGALLNGLFAILGIISVALLIYSGFIWMTARGNESKVTEAKENISNILIGLIFIINNYALATFLLKIFT